MGGGIDIILLVETGIDTGGEGGRELGWKGKERKGKEEISLDIIMITECMYNTIMRLD